MEIAGKAGRGSSRYGSPSLTVLTVPRWAPSSWWQSSFRDPSSATPLGRELPFPGLGPDAGWTGLSRMPL